MILVYLAALSKVKYKVTIDHGGITFPEAECAAGELVYIDNEDKRKAVRDEILKATATSHSLEVWIGGRSNKERLSCKLPSIEVQRNGE